jgi:hypothetical protein
MQILLEGRLGVDLGLLVLEVKASQSIRIAVYEVLQYGAASWREGMSVSRRTP